MTDLPESTLTKSQTREFRKIIRPGNEPAFTFLVTIRHDDSCGNGHNTFSITGEAYSTTTGRFTDSNLLFGGCCHDDIREHFPELAHLLRWHLCSTDGPLHYVANTLYHASDRDCWGRRKGEPYNPRTCIRFGSFPIPYRKCPAFTRWLSGLDSFDLEVLRVDFPKPQQYPRLGPKFTLAPFASDDWHLCPFDTEGDALEFLEALHYAEPAFITEFTQIGEGKDPDLEAARSCAIWPDATLEQLRDEKALRDRLPGLLQEFRKDVESLGFTY